MIFFQQPCQEVQLQVYRLHRVLEVFNILKTMMTNSKFKVKKLIEQTTSKSSSVKL